MAESKTSPAPHSETKADDITVDIPSPSLEPARLYEQAKVAGQSQRIRHLVRKYLDESNGTFIICDPSLPDTPIIYASPGFLRLTRYTEDEVLGRNCNFLQGPDTDFLTAKRIGEAVSRNQELSVHILNYKRDGEPFWNALYLAPVVVPAVAHDGSAPDSEPRSPAPVATYYVGIQTDVTVAKALMPDAEDSIDKPLLPSDDDKLSDAALAAVQPCKNPISLSFKDIRYHVPDETDPSKQKEVLHGVSGHVKSGQMLAIMGPSGSGKTTLLNILAGRTTSNVTGSITVNGAPRHKNDKRRMGFVMQDDVLFSHLSVKETLSFTAALRMPANTTPQDRETRVQQVIDLLQLNKCVDTKVGDVLSRGVSGGERKRVNIGVEVLTDPSMILLDEPTSGLDSSTALTLLKSLKALSQAGRTIVTSIHQPSSQIFAAFDTLMLMCEGNIVYFGPAADAVKYFAAPPLCHVCPSLFNPADYFMEIATSKRTAPGLIEAWKREEDAIKRVRLAQRGPGAGADASGATSGANPAAGSGPAPTAGSSTASAGGAVSTTKDGDTAIEMSLLVPAPSTLRARQVSVEDTPGGVSDGIGGSKGRIREHLRSLRGQNTNMMSWRAMNIDAASVDSFEAESTNTPSSDESKPRPSFLSRVFKRSGPPRWPTGFWRQLQILSARAFKQSRGESIQWLLFCQTAAMTFILSWLWWQIGDSAEDIALYRGLLFFVSVYNSFNPMFSSLMAFPAERAVLQRERAAGSYRLSAYFLSKSVVDIPFVLSYPLFMAVVVYWTCGLRLDAAAFVLYLCVMTFTCLAAEALGLLISAAVMAFRRALTVAAVLMLGFMLSGGYYVSDIPTSLKWFSSLGFTTYSFSALMRVQFPRDETYECVNGVPPSDFETSSCPITGDAILDRYATSLSLGYELLILAVMTMGYRFLAYVCLRYRTRVK